MSIVNWALTILQFLAITAALVGLLARRIPLPVFAGYLIFDLLLGVVSIWVQGSSKTAIYVWIVGQLLSAALWCFVFDEIRRRVLFGYPGIGMLATWVMSAAIALGIGVVWLTATEDRSQLMRFVIFVPRIVAGTLFIGMGIVGLLVRHYETDHQPNTLIHAKIFWFYLGSKALGMWAVNASTLPHVATAAANVLSLICFVSWALYLEQHRHVDYPRTASADDLRAAQQRSEQAIAELRDLFR